jgi:transposase
MLQPLVSTLLDVPSTLAVGEVGYAPAELTLFASSRRRSACCPLCARPSRRKHSRYERRIADVPLGSKSVTLRVQVRRFFCANHNCHRRIFAERLPDIAAPDNAKQSVFLTC